LTYLFDTNAISETFRRRPNKGFVHWLRSLPPEHQFTSIVVVGELFAGAFHSTATEKWVTRIETEVLPRLIVLDYDLRCAREFGRIKAELEAKGHPVGDLDTQIAATAMRHRLTLVTANRRHFEPIDDLTLRTFDPGAT
jgi:predicted nucleic acid-binding protein